VYWTTVVLVIFLRLYVLVLSVLDIARKILIQARGVPSDLCIYIK